MLWVISETAEGSSAPGRVGTGVPYGLLLPPGSSPSPITRRAPDEGREGGDGQVGHKAIALSQNQSPDGQTGGNLEAHLHQLLYVIDDGCTDVQRGKVTYLRSHSKVGTMPGLEPSSLPQGQSFSCYAIIRQGRDWSFWSPGPDSVPWSRAWECGVQEKEGCCPPVPLIHKPCHAEFRDPGGPLALGISPHLPSDSPGKGFSLHKMRQSLKAGWGGGKSEQEALVPCQGEGGHQEGWRRNQEGPPEASVHQRSASPLRRQRAPSMWTVVGEGGRDSGRREVAGPC